MIYIEDTYIFKHIFGSEMLIFNRGLQKCTNSCFPSGDWVENTYNKVY